ncbi:membrane-associating domain-containing protein [Hirsutella rhossiliensis]|uniref:Membrane-associating domain-containing protein n=1 Tax=Hirsutella rhossiliensis TaxID=111463 RepID=A0A9P8N1E4_9HYPO|nr:membrane-associating domain-containing protein [Hirsutella rhossiliensis]KAH0964822.1 membrane-associating domain-containing protein [Hirsutella rhossiliensis]
MGFGISTILHGVLAFFIVIELGLTGYMVSVTDDDWSRTPSRFSFMLFNSIWSILVLAYIALTPRFLERFYHGLVALGLLAVTTLFWFAGSIALAVWIGVGRCRGNHFCQSIQAAVAFGFFIWALFTALAVLAGLGAFRGGARADTTRKPSQPVV